MMHPQGSASSTVCVYMNPEHKISYRKRRSYITYVMCRDRKHIYRCRSSRRRKTKEKNMVVTEYANKTALIYINYAHLTSSSLLLSHSLSFMWHLLSGLATTNCLCYCCRQWIFVGCRHCSHICVDRQQCGGHLKWCRIVRIVWVLFECMNVFELHMV